MNVRKSFLLGLIVFLAASGLARAKQKDFNLAESGAALSGYWVPGTAGGRDYIGGSNGSQIDAMIVGKVVELTCYSDGPTNVSVTVDGVTYTPTFFKIREWTTLTVSLGKPGAHRLTIKQPFLGTSFYLDTGTGTVHGPTFSVRGNAPSMKAPAGFGPQYQLSDPVNTLPYIQAEGGFTQTNAAGYPSVYYAGPQGFSDQAIYFTATATGTIQGWVYGSGNLISLYQDGLKVGEVTTPVSSTYQWVTLFQGDGAPHRYGVASAYGRSPGFYIWSLMTVGGTLTPVATIPRPSLVTYGDSITLGFTGTGNDSSQAYSERLGIDLGWAVYNRGVIGSTVNEFSSGSVVFTTESGEARTSDVTSSAAAAKGIVILYGTNDMNQEGGPETIAQFQAAYQAMLSSIVAGVPATAQILCIGILPRTGYSPDTIASWNAGVQGAIATIGAPNVRYVDPSGWGLLQNNGPANDYTDPQNNTYDGLHPNYQGYTIMLNNLAPIFAPGGAPTILSSSSGTAQIGQALEYQTTASNPPLSFAATGLPPGMIINPSTGSITGIPTAGGVFTIDISATNPAGTTVLPLQLTVLEPVVTMTDTVPEITANGGEFGEVTFSIPAPRTSDLDVNFSIGGTAIAGTDYVKLSGVATIVTGSTSKVVRVKPLDGNIKGPVTVKFKLEQGQEYQVGTTAPVKVKILPGS